MKISKVTADDKAVDFTVKDADEAIEINLEKTGPVTVAIDYTAPLTDTMMGIYPSYYELAGVKKQIIGTQFETTSARQAFPCLDEPEAKATFSLALKFDEHDGEIALGNMPETKIEDGVHYFDKTVRMSTYLVAFAFGELQSKMTQTKDGVKVGVFATKAHKANELDFALDIAKRSIEFYEDFYQTKYPLPHSWQLALPDFSAGAMENWGLITYREAYLVLDPDNTTLETKKLVATVIAHELAHQWFGDLVTMQWWDNLWLNESFANMMEYVAIDAIEPNWHIWDMFQASEAAAALSRDATDGVQSVHVDVNNPAEIDSLFDPAIVYAKGSRLLVMVRALLGDDALRKGLKRYFDEHKYHNAAGDDLWNALSTATDLNIAEIMHSWLEQPGYPVVSASVNDEGHLILRQKQFFIGEGKDAKRIWQIPLKANFDAPQIMAKAELDLGDYQELRTKTGQPLRLNDGNSSHFIVSYDKTLLDDLTKNLVSQTAVTKLQLLQDLRLLAEGNKVSYAAIVPLLTKLANEESGLVITALYATMRKLRQFTTPKSSAENNLKQFYGQLANEQFDRLGLAVKKTDTPEDVKIRPYELAASLYSGNKAFIKEAHEAFTKSAKDLASLHADSREFVLTNEVKNFGSEKVFKDLLSQYVASSDAAYKADLTDAITATKDPAQIKQIVAEFKNAEVIKPQDLRGWFSLVLSNSEGEQAAWDWLRDNWDWLEKTVGGDMEFATFITVVSRAFHTKKRLDEFTAFFEPKINTPGLTREIEMDTKVIATKVALVEKEAAEVNEAIKAALK